MYRLLTSVYVYFFVLLLVNQFCMILMIKEDVKIETIGMLKQNVKNNNNGLMLPFANLVFVANKISAQLENEMLENDKCGIL